MRADELAVAMSEWPERRDREGESRWEAFRSRVLMMLENEQERLRLVGTQNFTLRDHPPRIASMEWIRDVARDAVEDRVDALVAEGSSEAARRVLHAVLANLSLVASLFASSEDLRLAAAERLVAFAYRLAELGDLDSAAAYVAPHVAFIQSKVARGYQTTDQALDLIARATHHTENPPSEVEGKDRERRAGDKTDEPRSTARNEPRRSREEGPLKSTKRRRIWRMRATLVLKVRLDESIRGY